MIFRSRLALPIALGLAAGVPYLSLDENLRQKATNLLGSVSSSADREAVALSLDSVAAQSDDPNDSIRNHVNSEETPLLFTPVAHDFRDVFRFDVTPNWVKSRWPRVSACGFADGLDGYRVPLVTGTKVDDIHGSLTYYFDEHHQVQRITFLGHTGDASRLVQLAMSDFGLQARPTNSAGLYLKTYHGSPVSALRIVNPAIVRADQPHTSLELMFEINGTHGSYRMSQSFRDTLERDRLAGRWR